MAHTKSFTQVSGLDRTAHSLDEVTKYVEDVIRLFLSDLAGQVKELRHKQRSRTSKTVVEFFYTLAKSAHPITDLQRLGIDVLKDFGDFLHSASQTLRDELLHGSLKSHDVLIQNLEPTAQFLSESLAALESRKDVIKILKHYIEHASEPELVGETTPTTAPDATATPFPKVKRTPPAFVKTTCTPYFGFSFESLFANTVSVAHYAPFNGHTKPTVAHSSASTTAASESTATPAVIRQFVKYLLEAANVRTQHERISGTILRTLAKLSQAPDIFSELSTLSFVPGLNDFRDFLLSQKHASSHALSRELADEVLTHLLSLFNSALSQDSTAAQLISYAESAPAEVNEALSRTDVATPSPATSAEPPKLDSSEKAPDSASALPSSAATPTESDYINYVIHILKRTQAQVKPDSEGYQQLSALIHSSDLLATLSQTNHEWLKEFANFIVESWLNRTPIEKLNALADDIVSSLAAALSAPTSHTLTEPIDSELEQLLSTLQPPPVTDTSEDLPKLSPEQLAQLTEEIESSIALPSSTETHPEHISQVISPPAPETLETATTSTSDTDIASEAVDTVSADMNTALDQLATDNPVDSELSDTLALLANTDDLNFQLDTSDESTLPNYVELARHVLRQVQASLPRTDAGKFASDFFENLLTSEDLLEALQMASLSPIRDIGNYILSANQSKPTEELFRSRLTSKANEAIGILFSEFEQHHLQNQLRDDETFSPSDLLDDSNLDTSSDVALPTLDDLLVPTSSSHQTDGSASETSDLETLDDQLFNNLDVLSDEILPESLSVPDSPFEIGLTSSESSTPTASESVASEAPASLESSPNLSISAKETTPAVPESDTSASSSDTDVGHESLDTDLLTSELLLDESLLTDTTLEPLDTLKSELSSLHDLSAQVTTPDEGLETHLDDSLLLLDDSAFLAPGTLLDDSSLLSETLDTSTHSTPATSESDIKSPSESAIDLLSLSEPPAEATSTVSESTLLDDSLQTPQDTFAGISSGTSALDFSLPDHTDLLLDDTPAPAQSAPAQESATKFVPDELQQIFLEEATEYLEKLNEDLLALDKVADTQQPDLVNRVLRGSHTIKGSAAMVQLRNISDLAHKMEDALQLVRDKNLKVPKALIDVLFQSADAIGDMLKTFRTTGKDDHPKKEDLVAILQNYTQQLEQSGEIHSVLSLAELKESQAVEAVETATQPRRLQTVAEQTVRIDIRALNSLINLSAELVIARNRLNNELLAFNKSINRLSKERLHLAQISKKIMTMIQKGSKASGAFASYSDVLKEFSDTEFDRFSELDIISRDIKSAILNFDESISELKSIGSMLSQNVVKVSSIANDLNREIVGMRMVPVKQMFTRFSRSVRDIAKVEQKEINLVTEGEDTKLDKTVMEEVIEPIMHIVRNAIGHGIETPDVRRAHGKPPVGTITLRAYQKGSRVILEVEDDGSGINIEKVKAKAVQIGLITPEEAEKMTPAQATELIFRPGFSTADKVTELQGRGVGMDVVQNTIRRLKGTTNIETVSGKGTKFIISLPLTLAISDALLVTALDQTYAIPLEPVLETSYISTDTIEQDEDGKRYITLRDERIELRYLNDILGYQSDVMLFKAKVAVVIVKLEEEQKKIAVAVEKLIGKEEIVVKTLGKHLRNVRGIIGSTILGDGQVIIILDIVYLLRSEESRSRDVYVSVDNSAVETLSPSTEPAVPTVKRRRRKGAKITVLHADDSPSVRKYVQSVLKNADITVISADDGLAALNRLPSANVDLVITDLEMPRMNGFELISEIRRMPEYQDLPIIIVTARAGDKHRRTGLELGANAFLNKPFDPQQLIATIESFVS
jgi:chemotaxis protein histidine kinase CheA